MAGANPTQITEELNDIWRLVVGYAKQETTAPLRGIGQFMRYGVLGMVCFAIGSFFAALATLRGLQTETVLRGNGWQSAAAYFITLVVCAVVLALAGRSVARTPWKNKGETK